MTGAETSIILDQTPPTVTMTSPTSVRPSQSTSFSVADPASGVANISLSVDGQDVQDFFPGQVPPNGQFSDPGPWALGHHSWEIQTSDHVGNTADIKGSFSVASPPLAKSTSPRRRTPKRAPSVPRSVIAGGQVGRMTQQPRTLALWASDGLIDLKWSRWGRPTTSASGRETRHGYPTYRSTSRSAQVQLSQIQVCGGRRVYTHVRYRITGQRWISGHRDGCRLAA